MHRVIGQPSGHHRAPADHVPITIRKRIGKSLRVNSHDQIKELRNGILIGVIGLALYVGNPGLTAVGEWARYASMASGGVLLIFFVFLKCISSETNRNWTFAAFLGASFLELYQITRGDFMFEPISIGLRGLIYLSFLVGCVTVGGGSKVIQCIPNSALWKLLASIMFVQSAGYFLLQRTASATAVVDHVRHTADESLNPVGIAFVFGGMLVASTVGALVHHQWVWRIASYLTIALCSLNLVSTGSRGAWLAVIVALLAVVGVRLLKSSAAQFRKTLYFLAGAAALGISMPVYAATQLDALFNRFRNLSYGEDRSSDARIEIWNYYWKDVDQWICFGIKSYNGPYPHNIFYEFVLRFGIIGILMAVAVILCGWFLIRQCARQTEPSLLFSLGLLVFSFTNAQTSLSLEMNRWLFWAVGLGAAFALQRYTFFERSNRSHIATR